MYYGNKWYVVVVVVVVVVGVCMGLLGLHTIVVTVDKVTFCSNNFAEINYQK